MYQAFFNLQEPPFSITPDPRFLYLGQHHREALAHLLYSVRGSSGFILLTGEVGAGKTTVSRCLVRQTADHVDVALIFNPRLSALELVASICDELGIVYPETASIKTLYDALNRHLLNSYANNRITVLLLDEAQNLSVDLLEQVRLLSNLETDRKKLLQIILIGQPELVAILAQPELRQFSQRVTARYHIAPLTFSETRGFIRHRLAVAGCKQPIFSLGALWVIHHAAKGIPRQINQICDRALLGAYTLGRHRVHAWIAHSAVREVLGIPRRAIRRLLLATLLLLGLAVSLPGLSPFQEHEGALFRAGRAFVQALRQTGQDQLAPLARPSPATTVVVAPSQVGKPDGAAIVSAKEPVVSTPSASPTVSATAPQPAVVNPSEVHPPGGAEPSSLSLSPSRQMTAAALVTEMPPVVDSPLPSAEPSLPVVASPVVPAEPSPPVVASPVVPAEPSPPVVASPVVSAESSPPVVASPVVSAESSPPVVASPVVAPPVVSTNPPAPVNESPVGHDPQTPSLETLFGRPSEETIHQQAVLPLLFGLWGVSVDKLGSNLCGQALSVGMACYDLAGNWNTIRQLGLPVVVKFDYFDREPRYALVTALGRKTVTLQFAHREETILLSEADRYWFGQMTIVWRLTPGKKKYLGMGMQGEDIVWLRNQLARALKEGATGKGSKTFDAELQQRLRQFQAQMFLNADGMAGLRSLVALDLAAQDPNRPTPRLRLLHDGDN